MVSLLLLVTSGEKDLGLFHIASPYDIALLSGRWHFLFVSLKKGTEVKSVVEILNIYKTKEDIKDKSGS